MRARVWVGVTSRCSTGPDLLGIDRELDRIVVVLGAGGGVAGVELQQLFRIELDRVGVDVGRSGDRRGDDVGLGRQALRSRLDDVGAEMVEPEEADHQDEQAAEIER